MREIKKLTKKWMKEKVWENVIKKFGLIIAGPLKFISLIKHSSIDELFPALKFAISMSMLNLVFVLVFSGVYAYNLTLFNIDVIFTYTFWLVGGVCMHFAARLLKGNGNYMSSIISFLYLTAFATLAMFFLADIQAMYIKCLVDTPIDKGLLDVYSCYASNLGANLGIFASRFFLSVGLLVMIWYFITLTRVFRLIHNVETVRSAGIVILGAGIWFILQQFVEICLLRQLFKPNP